MEIPSASIGQLPKEFATADQFAARVLDQSESWFATLVGYPGQLIEPSSRLSGEIQFLTRSFRTLTLVTNTLRAHEWPTCPAFKRRPPHADRDIFVGFDQNYPIFEQNLAGLNLAEKPSARESVLLHGMSGCGIWLDQYEQDRIWLPTPILAGIQTGALHQAGWARGTTFHCWLEMVAAEVPEIRGVLRPQRHANSDG